MPHRTPQQESRTKFQPNGMASMGGTSDGLSSHPSPTRFWVISCVAHLLLFVSLGLLLRGMPDAPLVPPIRVTVIASGHPGPWLDDVSLTAQLPLPEQQLLVPDPPIPPAPFADAAPVVPSIPLPPPDTPERTPPVAPPPPVPAFNEVHPQFKSLAAEPPAVMQPARGVPTGHGDASGSTYHGPGSHTSHTTDHSQARHASSVAYTDDVRRCAGGTCAVHWRAAVQSAGGIGSRTFCCRIGESSTAAVPGCERTLWAKSAADLSVRGPPTWLGGYGAVARGDRGE
jgi:hypothetical protein